MRSSKLIKYSCFLIILAAIGIILILLFSNIEFNNKCIFSGLIADKSNLCKAGINISSIPPSSAYSYTSYSSIKSLNNQTNKSEFSSSIFSDLNNQSDLSKTYTNNDFNFKLNYPSNTLPQVIIKPVLNSKAEIDFNNQSNDLNSFKIFIDSYISDKFEDEVISFIKRNYDTSYAGEIKLTKFNIGNYLVLKTEFSQQRISSSNDGTVLDIVYFALHSDKNIYYFVYSFSTKVSIEANPSTLDSNAQANLDSITNIIKTITFN